MTDFRTLILCADDFGLNKGISEAILNLCAKERLSAVSCMANMPDMALFTEDLKATSSKIQKGLHFNLTEGYWVSQPETACYSLNKLLVKSHLHLIKPSFIVKELNAQLDKFIDLMGYLPDFIDGHQHVHQFPVVRQALLTVYKERLKQKNCFIRCTYPGITVPAFRFKNRILAATGGKAFYTLLEKAGIPHNPYFAGVYDFNPNANYRVLFRYWLETAPEKTLIMCHPGDGAEADDSIVLARRAEMNYFLSDDFVHDCMDYKRII